MISRIILGCCLYVAVVAKPLTRLLTVHESLSSVPSSFVHSGPADADSVLKLRVVLVQRNPSGLIDALYNVSTPSSTSYGLHLTKEEVEQYIKPRPDTIMAVNAWLKDNDVHVSSVSPAGDSLSLSIPVRKANELFDADFGVYTHSATGRQTIRTTSYSIPNELRGHIDFVHPTIFFEDPRGRLTVVPSAGRQAQSFAACSSAITPACVQSLYGIPRTSATQRSNGLGVSGFIDQFANQADLTLFLNMFRPDLTSEASTTFALQTLDGGENPQNRSQAGNEANLDIQYTVGIASGVPTTFISVGDTTHDGSLQGFLDIVEFLLSERNPPHVLTTSYGSNESDFPPSLAKYLCNAFAQLGARGTSILFASGDGGVAGSRAESCSAFVPTFPSGCPFMTSVGATEVTSSGVETAAFFSSGGFSNYFGIPSFQAAAVNSYLSSIGSTNSGKFNRFGRAFPDVSAIGSNVEIVVDGQGELVDGTSCSSPIFASVIALINDELIAEGRSPLGFLNPFLYANPQAFHDITSGSNPGCGTNGFEAIKGWDPVTGLGTPNFAALRAAAGL